MAERDGRTWGTPTLIVVGGAALALGAILGSAALGDLGETPCWEVRARVQPLRDELANTFGRGETAQAAARSLARTADEHPGCFPPEQREFFADLADRAGAEPAATETATEVPGEELVPTVAPSPTS